MHNKVKFEPISYFCFYVVVVVVLFPLCNWGKDEEKEKRKLEGAGIFKSIRSYLNVIFVRSITHKLIIYYYDIVSSVFHFLDSVKYSY